VDCLKVLHFAYLFRVGMELVEPPLTSVLGREDSSGVFVRGVKVGVEVLLASSLRPCLRIVLASSSSFFERFFFD